MFEVMIRVVYVPGCTCGRCGVTDAWGVVVTMPDGVQLFGPFDTRAEAVEQATAHERAIATALCKAGVRHYRAGSIEVDPEPPKRAALVN